MSQRRGERTSQSALAVGRRGDGAQSGHGYYFFDDRYGDHSAAYIAVDPGSTYDHFPGEPAHLKCDVALERTIWAIFRRQRKTWVAPTGSYCAVLGRWTDGTVRLQLGLADSHHPDRHVSIDGRFPGWVVEVGGTRPVLASNIVTKRSRHGRALVLMLLIVGLLGAAYVALGVQVAPTTTTVTGVVAAPTSVPTRQLPTAVAVHQTGAMTSAVPQNAIPTAEVFRVANTNGQGVYMRRTPNMDDRVRAYPDGTEMNVIGDDVEAGGIQWRHVRAPDGITGYVPAEYVAP